MRILTQGRLVPRQPWAIKSTTRTELHHESIYFAKFIHWDNSAIPTQLRGEPIVRVTLLIIKGKMVQGIQSLSPALCFPRFAGFTNSDLWFSEERGEWLAMEMEEVILGLIGGGDSVDI